MANIVILGDKKYLVDVGYGVDGPVCPVLLGHTGLYTNIIGQRIKLRSQNLPQHTDPSQKVWVYSQCRGNWDGPWQEIYHFADTEVLPHDFDVLNFYNMTNSLWAHTVVVQHFIPTEDDDIQDIKGTLLLVGMELKVGEGMTTTQRVVETYETEEDRLDALRHYFGIVLSDEEAGAIIGRPTALTRSEP
jgi:arylamine N-acetyltransferase